jgi:2-polyprenyl-6-methoxyphenol hydroxylase-like FAD-dependent oxidoreductase
LKADVVGPPLLLPGGKSEVSARVAVVGAGPVGVVAAIACARKGMQVTLFEAETAIDHAPRAATTHPSTLEMLAELELVDEFIALGLIARHFQLWDRDKLVAEFDHDVLKDETPFPYVVQTEQHKLCELGLRRLAGMANAEVQLGTRVLDLAQDDARVGLYVEGRAERESHEFDYAIACDGGRSTVRKCLDIEFEGYTWPERFLVLTSLLDFGKAIGCCPRTYISDPEEWINLFKVTGDDFRGRWRAVFPARENETDEEAFSEESVLRRLRRLVPGHPLELVVHRNLYRVHQRVAQSFRRGRVFLAGDAAHINNPVGGLGLNCGIHDAMDLADTLAQVSGGSAGPELLDRYERRRRLLNIEYVQQQTVANKKRLEESDPRVREANFEQMRRIAGDPVLHKEYLMRTSLIESVRKARGIR